MSLLYPPVNTGLQGAMCPVNTALRHGLVATLTLTVAVFFSGCAGNLVPKPPQEPNSLPSAPIQMLPETRQRSEKGAEEHPTPQPSPENSLTWTPSHPIASLASDAWLDRTAEATGIPRRALAAYAGASLEVTTKYSECRVGWNTIAGIGFVETLHGTYPQSNIEENGQATPRILGPVLDGNGGFMAIEDTDKGKFDGDTKWDRAVGPLQFIPTTWDYIGQDGNADGEKDPHNIDDAALAAAVYLCQEQRDMSTDEGWQGGVLAYNRSVEYANRVARYAENYRAAILP